MKTLLIVGFGDIARRAVPHLLARFRVLAMVRSVPAEAARAHEGVQVEPGDLDRPETLDAFTGRATHVLHCAPPPRSGIADLRTAHLLAALERGIPPQRLVYISTSGVYGDCAGGWVDESRAIRPATDRARRRADAEVRIMRYCEEQGARAVILRAPGIYASDRLPLQRLRNQTPALRPEEDVYTNHIHAEDLAAVVVAALLQPQAEGIYNVCDDSALRMGDWFDLLADRAGLPRPPRIARSEAAGRIPPTLMSFLGESRRLVNDRMKTGLQVALRYPTVYQGLPEHVDAPFVP